MNSICSQKLSKLQREDADITAEWGIKPLDIPMAVLFVLDVNSAWYFRLMLLLPYCFSAFSYVSLDSFETSLRESFCESLLLMILGSCFIIFDGCFELFFYIAINHFVLYKGLNVPLLKLNVIYSKFLIFRLVSIFMKKTMSLNIGKVFLTQFISGPLTTC